MSHILSHSIRALVVSVVIAGTTARAQTNGLADLPRLKGLAEQYERGHLPADAARAYEQIVAADPTTQRVVLPRLVTLYAESKQREKCLATAREAMKFSPDPDAYLASVYAKLGGYPEAAALLDKALASDPPPARRAALLAQRADFHAQQGQSEQARLLREEAARIRVDVQKPASVR